MSLITPTRSLALAALIAATGLSALPAAAQEATEAPAEGTAAAPAEGTDLNMGTPEAAADGIGSTYVKANFETWEQRCVRTESGADPCQLYQLLKDGSGNSVAEIGLFTLPAGGEAVAGAAIIAPLETLLTAGLRIGVDDAQPKVYPFTFCSQVGCVARVGFTAAEVDGFKKGAQGQGHHRSRRRAGRDRGTVRLAQGLHRRLRCGRSQQRGPAPTGGSARAGMIRPDGRTGRRAPATGAAFFVFRSVAAPEPRSARQRQRRWTEPDQPGPPAQTR